MPNKNIAIRAESLGKMYRLGRERIKDKGLVGKLKQGLGTPFEWLASQMRPPGEEETFWALKDVSFEIRRGEVVGFVGHNGAGKSTLLKILSRITEPTEGFAEIHGRIAALLEVGTGMHPELTGRENIYMNGTVLGMRKREIDGKFDEIVDFSGIEKFIDTPVKRYSSGMRVRLGFAIAAHLEPEILVVDEVLAVGDAEFQAKCLGKMEDVASGGRTVLFVSHNMAAVENLCSRAYLLENGSLVLNSTTEDVVTRYVAEQMGLADVPLAERKDRKGNGAIRFRSVKFLSADGSHQSQVISGKPLTIILEFEGRVASSIRSVDLHIGFYTARGQVMFTCSSAGSGYSFNRVPSNGRLICQIEKLPLSAGKYPYNLYSTVQGQEADWVKNAGALTVVDGDFFGSGRTVSHPEGFLVEQKWTLECP